MRNISAESAVGSARLNTAELRAAYLVRGLFQPGRIELCHWETDRAIIGGVVPLAQPLVLDAPSELRASAFCERREVGIINLGGPGVVAVDGVAQAVRKLDCLYLGRGVRRVEFSSDDPASPARFYLLSYPAQTAYPTTLVRAEQAESVALGSTATANVRRIFKYIHPAGVRSAQLVMGLTLLEPGSVWNTLPPHTHGRRSEVYLYFDLPADSAVFHFMGLPTETRHLVVRDGEAVLSPPWSVHCGAGACHYGFMWGMGGENQEFADMDATPVAQLL